MQRRRSLQTRAKVSFLNTFHNNVFQERNFFFLNAFLRKRARTPRRGNGLLARKAENGKLEICQQEKEQKKTIEPMRISSLKETISWSGWLHSISIRVQLFKICSLVQKRQSVFIPSIAIFVIRRQDSKRTTLNRRK